MDQTHITRRLLYVDDDLETRTVMSLLLSSTFPELDIIVAPNGQDAISLASSGTFDMFILDTILPDMSGIQLCKELRTYHADLPIIFYSAMARPEDMDRALEAGGSEYLIKPNDMEKLLELVSKQLSGSRGRTDRALAP